MAQMPASYLTEKVVALTVDWEMIDTASGLIDLTDRHRRYLAALAQNAQAIVNEILDWTTPEMSS